MACLIRSDALISVLVNVETSAMCARMWTAVYDAFKRSLEMWHVIKELYCFNNCESVCVCMRGRRSILRSAWFACPVTAFLILTITNFSNLACLLLFLHTFLSGKEGWVYWTFKTNKQKNNSNNKKTPGNHDSSSSQIHPSIDIPHQVTCADLNILFHSLLSGLVYEQHLYWKWMKIQNKLRPVLVHFCTQLRAK